MTNGASVFNYAAAATSSTLNISNGVTAGAITLTGTGLLSQNVNSTGSANTTGALTLAATTTTATVAATSALTLGSLVGAGLTSLTVTGAGAVDLGTAGPATLASLTASTGGLTYIAGNVAEAATGTADLTFTGSTGSDSLSLVNLDAGDEVSISLGDGNDTLILDGTAVINETTDSVNGGDGADDVIQITATATLDADFSAVVSGFESIRASGAATITLAGLDEFSPNRFSSTVGEAAADGDNDGGLVVLSLDGLATGATVTLDAAATAVTRDTNVAEDNDGVSVNVSLTTDGAADSITFNVADSYEVISDDAEDDFETVNVNFTGTTAGVIEVLDFGAATLVDINATAANITIDSLTVAADAAVNAAGVTTNITISAMAGALDSYTGGSGNDDVTITAGSLVSSNTFADGNGSADILRVTTNAADQDGGVLGVTGFETIAITNGAGGDISFTADLRNVSGLQEIIATATTAATDDLVLNRINSGVNLNFASGYDQVTTSTQTGVAQLVEVSAAATIVNLTLDSATTTLTVTSDNGNDTADEANAEFTDIDGTAWTTLTVLGSDRLNAGTLENGVTVDASGASGRLTVTLGATATSAIGSSAGDSITGGAGIDTITGGDGVDTISGAAGADVIVFASTGALNDADIITAVIGAGGDVYRFSNFMSGSVNQNGAAGTAINEFTIADVSDVNIANTVSLYSDADALLINTTAEIAALVQGAGDAFSITSGGKAVLITGDAGGANDTFNIWYINDALDGTNGTLSATDVVLVGTSAAAVDLDTFVISNFSV